VQWLEPSPCDHDTFDARVRARLPPNDANTRVHVRVRVTQQGKHEYLVELRLSGTMTGQRALLTESCAAARDAAVMLVALALEPTGANVESNDVVDPPYDAAKDAEDADRAPAPDDAETAESNDADQAAAAPPREEANLSNATDVTLGLSVGVPVDLGTAPDLSVGALVQIHASFGHALFAATATWLGESDTTTRGGASLSAGWLSAALDACYLWGATHQLGPCHGAELGQLSAATRGLIDGNDAKELVAFASGSVLGRWSFTPRWYASAWVGARTPLWYPRLMIVDAGEAFRPAAMGIRIAVGITLVLG
jgi:hypothetical protein